MGDMADYILDNSPDEFDWVAPDRPHQCAYCMKSGFHWAMTDKGWRLHTPGGKVHTCKAYSQSKLTRMLQKQKPAAPGEEKKS
jgi:hypothetical protein